MNSCLNSAIAHLQDRLRNSVVKCFFEPPRLPKVLHMCDVVKLNNPVETTATGLSQDSSIVELLSKGDYSSTPRGLIATEVKIGMPILLKLID